MEMLQSVETKATPRNFFKVNTTRVRSKFKSMDYKNQGQVFDSRLSPILQKDEPVLKMYLVLPEITSTKKEEHLGQMSRGDNITSSKSKESTPKNGQLETQSIFKTPAAKLRPRFQSSDIQINNKLSSEEKQTSISIRKREAPKKLRTDLSIRISKFSSNGGGFTERMINDSPNQGGRSTQNNSSPFREKLISNVQSFKERVTKLIKLPIQTEDYDINSPLKRYGLTSRQRSNKTLLTGSEIFSADKRDGFSTLKNSARTEDLKRSVFTFSPANVKVVSLSNGASPIKVRFVDNAKDYCVGLVEELKDLMADKHELLNFHSELTQVIPDKYMKQSMKIDAIKKARAIEQMNLALQVRKTNVKLNLATLAK